MKKERTLLEDFVILLLHPEKGRLMAQGNTLAQAVAIAALTGLLQEEILVVGEGRVRAKGMRLTGNKVYDVILRKIHYADKPRSFRYWTRKFYFSGGRFLKDTLYQLVQKNILYERERSFLNVFSYKTYFPVKNGTRRDLLRWLQPVVYGEEPPDLRAAVLLQLLDSCNLGRVVVRKRADLRMFRKKIKMFRQDREIMGEYADFLKEVKKAAAVSEAVPGV